MKTVLPDHWPEPTTMECWGSGSILGLNLFLHTFLPTYWKECIKWTCNSPWTERIPVHTDQLPEKCDSVSTCVIKQHHLRCARTGIPWFLLMSSRVGNLGGTQSFDVGVVACGLFSLWKESPPATVSPSGPMWTWTHNLLAGMVYKQPNLCSQLQFHQTTWCLWLMLPGY